MPFSVGLYTLFLSFHVPVISPFLSTEYRVSRLRLSLTEFVADKGDNVLVRYRCSDSESEIHHEMSKLHLVEKPKVNAEITSFCG